MAIAAPHHKALSDAVDDFPMRDMVLHAPHGVFYPLVCTLPGQDVGENRFEHQDLSFEKQVPAAQIEYTIKNIMGSSNLESEIALCFSWLRSFECMRFINRVLNPQFLRGITQDGLSRHELAPKCRMPN